MPRPTQSPVEAQVSEVFRSLSDPTRRRILALLRTTPELSVGDIATAFAMSLNGVSKHIKQLEKAGLVRRRVQQNTHYLSFRAEGIAPVLDWLNIYHHAWSERLDALDRILREEENHES